MASRGARVERCDAAARFAAGARFFAAQSGGAFTARSRSLPARHAAAGERCALGAFWAAGARNVTNEKTFCIFDKHFQKSKNFFKKPIDKFKKCAIIEVPKGKKSKNLLRGTTQTRGARAAAFTPNTNLRRFPPVMCTANIVVRVERGRINVPLKADRGSASAPKSHAGQMREPAREAGRSGNAGREVLYVQIRFTQAHEIGGQSNVQR